MGAGFGLEGPKAEIKRRELLRDKIAREKILK
jgi:hypothetical protein